MLSSRAAGCEKSNGAGVRHLPYRPSFLKCFLHSKQFFAANRMLIKPSETNTVPPMSPGVWLTCA